MKVIRSEDVPMKAGPGDAVTRVLVDRAAGADGMSMGWMVFPPGGETDTHVRDVEEAIYILRGTSAIHFDRETVRLDAGDAIFIPPGTQHRHQNVGEGEMEHLWFFAPQGPEQKLHDLPDAWR